MTQKQSEHKPEPKAEHKPEPKSEHKDEPKQLAKTVKVQMQKGTDEVNHGTTKYQVSNKDWTVELPPHVAEHVIRQGGAQLIEEDVEPSSDLISVQHVSDKKATLSYAGVNYDPDKDGKMSVPVVSVDEIAPHGFHPC